MRRSRGVSPRRAPLSLGMDCSRLAGSRSLQLHCLRSSRCPKPPHPPKQPASASHAAIDVPGIGAPPHWLPQWVGSGPAQFDAAGAARLGRALSSLTRLTRLEVVGLAEVPAGIGALPRLHTLRWVRAAARVQTRCGAGRVVCAGAPSTQAAARSRARPQRWRTPLDPFRQPVRHGAAGLRRRGRHGRRRAGGRHAAVRHARRRGRGPGPLRPPGRAAPAAPGAARRRQQGPGLGRAGRRPLRKLWLGAARRPGVPLPACLERAVAPGGGQQGVGGAIPVAAGPAPVVCASL
jgi:hypothetical protein